MQNSKILFRCEIQNLKPSEILDMISAAVYERIKARDDKPEFRAYIIGHEGEADAKMLGIGKQIFRYFRQAITKIWQKLDIGTPVFAGHGKDTNAHDFWEYVGEVVGKALKKIDDKLTAIAAVYIEPSERQKKLDIASIEADVMYERINDELVNVNTVTEITGIALGNSDSQMPGFPGAKLLGAIQALKVQHNHKKEGDKVEKSEIIQAIKDGKFKPSDIFTIDELKVDPQVDEHVKKEKQTEYEHAKRVEKKLGDERTEWTKKENEFTEKIGGLEKQVAQSGMSDTFKTLATERKLSDKQVAFINKNLGNFKTEKTETDGIKLDLNTFIDSQLNEFRETAKLLGVEIKEEKQTDQNTDENAATPATDGNSQDGDKSDLTVPENNPLIPKVG